MGARAEVLQHLAERIRQIEAAPARGQAALRLPLLDALVDGRELRGGLLIELAAAVAGAGAWTLALCLARQACVSRPPLVIVDPRGWFYPPAAAALGVDLEQVILIRPASAAENQAVLDQALRCSAVGAVVAWCERLRAAEAQRLRLAAEAGGGLGLLLGPPGRDVSAADLRLRIVPLVSRGFARRLQVEVVRWRGGSAGRTLIVEIDDETGHVHLPAGLASPETGT
jgi:protein ImuA